MCQPGNRFASLARTHARSTRGCLVGGPICGKISAGSLDLSFVPGACARAFAFAFTSACKPIAVLVSRGGTSRVTATAGLLLFLVMSACLNTAEIDIKLMNEPGTNVPIDCFGNDVTQMLASRLCPAWF